MKIESIIVLPDAPRVSAVKDPLATTIHIGKLIGELVAKFEASSDKSKVMVVWLNKIESGDSGV